jgi:hypothetical protein
MRPSIDALQLWSPLSFLSGIVRKFGENVHFQWASNLEEQGQRARVMLLLCWVIGHRLPRDKIYLLVSTAVGDGLERVGRGDQAGLLLQLRLVETVLMSLVDMIETWLPLKLENSPYCGEALVSNDEDKPIAHTELWVYNGDGYGYPFFFS